MSTLTAVQVVALLSTGLKAGVLFGDRIGPRFARPELSPSSFVRFQQVQLRYWEKFMPALSGIGLISNLVWLLLIWPEIGNIGFTLVAVATIAFTSSIVFAVAGCLPINKQLMKWSVSSPPSDVMKTWVRWERVNDIRAFLVAIAFVCVVLALAASNGAGT